MKKLFLVPTPISDDTSGIPEQVIRILKSSTHFICERVRTTRRFIRSIIKDFDIDAVTFIELDKRGSIHQNQEIVECLKSGKDFCFMSEAGSPCIADPGSELVNMARKNEYTIVPLSGPSSIILALMASGMNGQQFSFRGYLPVKKDALRKELKHIEKEILKTGYTQIFIETPYRNAQMFAQICEVVNPSIRLHIALHIHSDQEHLVTKPINKWISDNKMGKILNEKAPCIFILGK